MEYVKKNTNKRCIVDVLLPGYDPKDVKVITGIDNENSITITAKMKTNLSYKKLGYYKKQPKNDKSIVKIDNRFDLEEAVVSFDNGLMRIDIPKKEENLGITIHPEDSENEPESEE